MEDLNKQVARLLATEQRPGPTEEQSRVIRQASQLFDELRAKGLVDAPRYKLAPMDAVPPKSLSGGPRPVSASR